MTNVMTNEWMWVFVLSKAWIGSHIYSLPSILFLSIYSVGSGIIFHLISILHLY